MVAIRQLRQPDVIEYPQKPARVVRLETRVDAAFAALMARLTDAPLTESEWREVFLLWDIRRFIEWGFVSEAEYLLARGVIDENGETRRVSLEDL